MMNTTGSSEVIPYTLLGSVHTGQWRTSNAHTDGQLIRARHTDVHAEICMGMSYNLCDS